MESHSNTKHGSEEYMALWVAVVDDCVDLATTVAEMLKAVGCEVVGVFHSGEELLDQLENGLAPDVVITDFDMPGMNGEVLLQNVRMLAPGAKGVMMTGERRVASRENNTVPTLLKGNGTFFEDLKSTIATAETEMTHRA